MGRPRVWYCRTLNHFVQFEGRHPQDVLSSRHVKENYTIFGMPPRSSLMAKLQTCKAASKLTFSCRSSIRANILPTLCIQARGVTSHPEITIFQGFEVNSSQELHFTDVLLPVLSPCGCTPPSLSTLQNHTAMDLAACANPSPSPSANRILYIKVQILYKSY
ncbi:hypothetical protein Acr_05g0015870 [Actinidia rufa]|uniref:Uncharacterized protein n=1 Tax=Actinidia rufa TaxID=165716 RepID=A0A7J0EN86_9ERIC|nr:hypothetical protein Acr_05g0015870 [Actinidia rufa]